MKPVKAIKPMPPFNSGEVFGLPDDLAEKAVKKGDAVFVDKKGNPIKIEEPEPEQTEEPEPEQKGRGRGRSRKESPETPDL